MKTNDPIKLTKRLKETLKELAETQILVGLPAELEKTEDTQDDDGVLFLADIATINNFGSKSRNIPERPFGTTTIPRYKKQIMKFYQAETWKAVVNKQSVSKAFNRVGAVGAGFMRKNLTDGGWAKNSDVTIFGSKNGFIKGKGGTNPQPLIDTGEMRRSITWVLREGNNVK